MATPATPKRSFRRTVASTVEERTPRFLLGSLALGMVISLVTGIGIGIATGGNDTDSAGITTVTRPRTATSNPRANNASAFAPAPVKAVVVRSLPRSLVIRRGTRNTAMVMQPKSRITVVRPASRSDIKAGARVLFVLGAGATVTPTTSGDTGAGPIGTGQRASVFVATHILIVSGAAANRLGSRVFSVGPDSMTFRARNGKIVKVLTVGATVSKTAPGTRAQLLPGRRVLVKSVLPPAPKKKRGARVQPKRVPVVIEIVALPDGSPFG